MALLESINQHINENTHTHSLIITPSFMLDCAIAIVNGPGADALDNHK